jgi:hypothetical protein
MNLHPDFYSPYPLHVMDMMSTVAGYGDLNDNDNYFRLILDVVGLQNSSLIRWDHSEDPLELFDVLKNEPRSIHRVVGELCVRAGRGKKVVMDKSQDSVCAHEELVDLFPDMRFIDVVRDPRAQVSSMNRSIIYDYDTLLNTTRWVEGRRWVDQIYEKYPDRILTVRFEDFINNQEAELKRICDFLGLTYMQSLTHISRSDDARVMSVLSPLWETNSSDPLQTTIDKYRQFLSPDEIEHIEHASMVWMKKYGYVPQTRACSILPYTLDVAREWSEERKRDTWRVLKKTYPKDFCMRSLRMRYIASLSSSLCTENDL